MRSSPWLAVLLALAGCDVVFRLEEPPVTCAALDEDCDDQLDVDDSCPGDADANEDEDVDGVADACDPNRTGTADALVLFDGFNDRRNAWDVDSGTWAVEAGAMVQPTPADGLIALTFPARTRMSVLTFIEDLDGAEGARAGLVGGIDMGPRLECHVVKVGTGIRLLLELYALGTVFPFETDVVGGGPFRMIAGQLPDGRFFCRARSGDGLDAEVIGGLMGAAESVERIGLLTSGASARFTSVTVFAAP